MKKEDKTSKPDFNKSGMSEKPKVHRNYTTEEMIRIIDHYVLKAKTPEQRKYILDIKEAYIKTRERRVTSVPERNNHYQHGIDTGLHPRETLENLDKQDREQDQRDRNRAVDKTKTYYHQNYSLSKKYKEAKTRTKIKEKTKE